MSSCRRLEAGYRHVLGRGRDKAEERQGRRETRQARDKADERQGRRETRQAGDKGQKVEHRWGGGRASRLRRKQSIEARRRKERTVRNAKRRVTSREKGG